MVTSVTLNIAAAAAAAAAAQTTSAHYDITLPWKAVRDHVMAASGGRSWKAEAA